MIQITYNRRFHRVRIFGHAGAAPKGQDMVCAAVSMLAHTLGRNVIELRRQGNVSRARVRLESGDSRVSCQAAGRMDPVVTLIFDAVCAGFALLEKSYPNYVRYTVLD